MPIFTLCSKSMPSTDSRKPWTKCWRDCSPSVAMSMPASSCSFSQSSVASRFAFSRSAPCARQVGQSLLVSASQPGFGRLPAMVVLSIAILLAWHHKGWGRVGKMRRRLFVFLVGACLQWAALPTFGQATQVLPSVGAKWRYSYRDQQYRTPVRVFAVQVEEVQGSVVRELLL